MQISRTAAFVGGVAAALVLGAGSAMAGVGPSLVLGKASTTKAVTTLTSRTGTPLSLNAKKGYPPLKVGSDVTVKNLDADKLDGQDASAFLPAGGTAADASRLGGLDPGSYGTTVYGASTSPAGVPLVNADKLETVTAPAGTYLLQFTATLTNPYEAAATFECDVELAHGEHIVDTVGVTGTSVAAADPDDRTLGAVAISQVVAAPDPLTVFAQCSSTSGNATHLAEVTNSSLTATRLQTFVGTVPTLEGAA